MTPEAGLWRLVVLLRVAGSVLLIAFLAMCLPVEWIASTHRWLGLGEFPRAPVVVYLARSVAALYGFHGVLVLLVSSDPLRYRNVVWYLAAMNVLFGMMILLIDIDAGMPLTWTLFEGPPVVAFGLLIAALNASVTPMPDRAVDSVTPQSTTPTEAR
jgi:hypothetical protein